MSSIKCHVGRCQEEATTEGVIWAKPNGGNPMPQPAWACDLHSHRNGFFEMKGRGIHGVLNEEKEKGGGIGV